VPGVMMGFMDNIALKSKTIQMDFMSHKDVVKFTDDTAIKYVKSFEDIRNYKGKGFQINYIVKDGENIAKEIIRFDILKAITDDEKLSLAQFMELRKEPQVKVYDVRPPVKYKMGHIPGAEPMPAPAFDKFVKNLPDDKTTPIVFYGVGGCLSPTASMKTKSLGYQNVKIFTGGFPEWSRREAAMISPDWLKEAIDNEFPHVLIDLRTAEDVEKGHITGAVNITLAGLDKSKDQFPVQKNAPIIFYGPDSDKAAALVITWGYRAVRQLPMDFASWLAAGNPVAEGKTDNIIAYVPKAKPGTISIEEFNKMAAGLGKEGVLVDVRNPDEFDEESIAGAVNIPVEAMNARIDELPADKEVVLFCNTGARAEMAHNLLNKAKRKNRYLDARLEFDEGYEIEAN
jgi:rhodanese-related sulfurtransferase